MNRVHKKAARLEGVVWADRADVSEWCTDPFFWCTDPFSSSKLMI
jgi:hypothetical protein